MDLNTRTLENSLQLTVQVFNIPQKGFGVASNRPSSILSSRCIAFVTTASGNVMEARNTLTDSVTGKSILKKND